MLPFFRKIRWRLAQDNQFFKYSRYAFGEILLVVIGILIALQINNWNEQRKLKIEEVKILNELRSDLNQSRLDIQKDQLEIKKQQRSLQIISDYLSGKLPYQDSIDSHFSSLEVFHTFSINKSTFEHINNTNGSLISNDSLRRSVSKFYTHVVNLYKEIEDRVMQEHYINYLKPMMISEFKTYKETSLKPRNLKSFSENMDNLQVINYTIVMIGRITEIQNLLLNELQDLDSKIEKELIALD